MDGLVLRKANQADIEFAYLVKKAAFKEYVEKVWGWDEDEQIKYHERRFRTQEFRIINLDGIDIGVMATVNELDCLTVNQLFILPEYQNIGIGYNCMMMIIEEADNLNLPVRLKVFKD